MTAGLPAPSDIQRRRIAYRRRQTVRSVLVAATSTGVVGVLLVVAVTGSPGWDRVRTSFFNADVARASFPAVLAMIRDLKGDGMTMVLATHEMGFARQVADQVVFLDGGRVRESGPPAQVLGDPTEPRTRQFLARIIEAGRL